MKERALSVEEQVLALASKRDMQAAGGLEVCAGETGLSIAHLSRCGSNHQADSLTLRDAATIGALADRGPGTPHVLHALARLHGKIVIDGPGAVDGDESVQAAVMQLAQELGDVSRSVSLAVADGRWTPREADAVLVELDQLFAVASALRGRVMRIKRELGESQT